MPASPDVLILGGGVIGLTSAYFLARAGASVHVYDRGDLGREASWAGAGIVPPGRPDRAATPADRLRGIGSVRFPQLSAELLSLTGIDNGYRRCGALEFLSPDDTDVVDMWRAEGIAFERLTMAEARALEPLGTVEGEPYLLPGCAQVRNPWHLRALITACERAGVTLRPGEGADGWEFTDARVTGVRLSSGVVARAGNFLLATGAWSKPLLQPLGHTPHVYPVRGQIAAVRGATGSRVLMLGKRYIVPRGDGLTLIGSTEEPEAGFENRTTPEGIGGLVAFAQDVLRFANGPIVEASWSGLRPGSPDGLPYLGPVPGTDRVFVAAGHFRAGVQLSVGTAQVVTELLAGHPACVDLRPFALDRRPGANAKSAFRS
ncbi:FAD-dependent oxidoreductase [Gemmata sp. JC717]|uniref:NAD(P)/FAD-dependent oxidoreductase n=1 Tax=Gemmata algarum TaxID=2975278 RepID=UPI0021BB3A8E|nr:FAD-dependent oxidoreductase [Gemmata algarum]MDY3553130.1 FAD-dependent oxidoreductase [Gemmata algarum]